MVMHAVTAFGVDRLVGVCLRQGYTRQEQVAWYLAERGLDGAGADGAVLDEAVGELVTQVVGGAGESITDSGFHCRNPDGGEGGPG